MNNEYTLDNNNREYNGSWSSITKARGRMASDREFANNGFFQENNKALEDQIKLLKEVNTLTDIQRSNLNDIIASKENEQKYDKATVKNYKDALDAQKNQIETTIKLTELYYKAKVKEASLIDDELEKQKQLQKLSEDKAKQLEDYSDALEKVNTMMKNFNEGSKSQLDAFVKGLDGVKKEIKDLALVKGVSDMASSMFGSGSSNMLATYNNTRTSLGLNNREFNQFKSQLFNTLSTNNSLTSIGWKDTSEYLAKLGDLNITSQEMAEQQYLAVVQGTKYLGLSTDTQAKILKLTRDTGRTDLLQKTNETMVQIMNAQLGVSKEQLDKIANQSASMTDLINLYSGNADALQNLTKYGAAIEKVYGSGAREAAMNVASDLLQNGLNSQYLPLLASGGDVNEIIRKLNSGDGSALVDIITASKNSQISQTARQGGTVASTLGSVGFDRNMIALTNANAQGSVESEMENIENSSKDTAAFIKDLNKSLTEKITNAGSNILSLLPFNEWITLQNAYYALALTRVLITIPRKIDEVKGAVMTGNGNMDPTKSGNMFSMLKDNFGKVLGYAAISVGIYKLLQGIFGGGSDTNPGENTANTLLGGALTGGGIGFLAGGVPGALAGAGIGLVGGFLIDLIKHISQDSAGDANAPVVSMPSSKYSGRGTPIGRSSFPWNLTSPYGYRGTIQTAAGPTNPFHNGIDLAYSKGTPIGANNAGTVSSAGTASDGANYVIINSGDGLEQVYWHLNQPSHLKRGDRVNEGQLIGYMGMTGHATGPHLHFGMRKAGTQSYMDPISLMNMGTFYPTEDGYSNEEVKDSKDSERLLEKIISADTMSSQAASVAYSSMGDSQGIINSVDRGFEGLNKKLDELSNRQDNQEQILKVLTTKNVSKAYEY